MEKEKRGGMTRGEEKDEDGRQGACRRMEEGEEVGE